MSEESGEELPVMEENEWPIYAVLMKHGDLYYHEPGLGNRYNTGDGWLMVLPWGGKRERGGITRGDNRFGVEHEDVAAFTLLTPNRRPASDEARLREAFSKVRDKAVALRVSVGRVINRPRTWRELLDPEKALASALAELSRAEISCLPASPSAEPCPHCLGQGVIKGHECGCGGGEPVPAKEGEKR